ncbi:MAG: ATP-binding protein [Legionella sp.]|uniref:PAS domain-containing sensor histidine kinase n=1 Tax=Legionella sp. TaxID=459 RepID=UPI00283F6F43|nr:ATP-binding protein [Legionella sp.]
MNIIKNKLNQSILSIGTINRIFSKKIPIKLIKKIIKPHNSFISFIIDTSFSIKKLNSSASRLLETNRKMLINQSLLNYIPAKHQKQFLEKIEQLIHTNLKQACEIEIFQQDGTSRNVIFQCSRVGKEFISIDGIETSSIRQSQCNDHDIELLTLINKLFHHADDAIAVLDNELNVKISNQLFTDLLLRMTSQSIRVGMNLDKVFPKQTQLKRKIITACKNALSGQKTSIIIENPNKESDIYYCYEIRLNSIYNAYRQKNELIFRIKDTTNYKLQHKLQADITKTCKNSVISAMTTALAHEIIQPLTAIATYSRSCLFMLKNKSCSDNLEETLSLSLEKISSQAELAGEIISNMKQFIREEHIYVEKTDINQLIHDALSIFHYELLDLKLKITLSLEDNLPRVLINRTHIIQVILNLGRNSIEAFQKSNEENPELTIETSASEKYVQITIRDNGPGVPKEYMDKILSSYFTTKKQGRGIGLHICRTLIENHGGKLNFQAEDRKGACFILSVPFDTSNEQN